MSDKSQIKYWLREAGSKETGLNILNTECTKVPEIGEVININTKIDREKLIIQFKEIKGESLQLWLRQDERQVCGDFVVVSVKRWFRVIHKPSTPSHLPIGLESSSICTNYISFPEEYTVEDFEVMVEPFRHTELTETPIARLRNMLSPMYGYFQMMQALKEVEGDDAKKDLKVLIEEIFKTACDNMDEIIDLVRDKKIWK